MEQPIDVNGSLAIRPLDFCTRTEGPGPMHHAHGFMCTPRASVLGTQGRAQVAGYLLLRVLPSSVGESTNSCLNEWQHGACTPLTHSTWCLHSIDSLNEWQHGACTPLYGACTPLLERVATWCLHSINSLTCSSYLCILFMYLIYVPALH